MKNLSLKLKLVVITMPAIIMLVIISIVLIACQQIVYVKTKEALYDQLYVANDNMLNAERNLYQAYECELSFKVAENMTDEEKESKYNEYDEKTKQYEEKIKTAFDTIKKEDTLYNMYDFGKIEEDMNSQYKQWQNSYDINTGKGSMKDHYFTFASLIKNSELVEKNLEDYVQVKCDYLEYQMRKTGIAIIIIVTAMVSILIAISTKVGKLFEVGIKLSLENVNILAAKDLSNELKVIDSKDELGVLSRKTNVLFNTLRDIIMSLASTAETMSTAAKELNENTNDATEHTGQIAESISEIATTVNEQATDVESVMSEVSKLEKSAVQSNKSAEKLSKSSNDIQMSANRGVDVVTKLSEATENVKESFDVIFSMIQKIVSSAENISNASDIISSIAEQTNLLSLNATIEAARAGEAGAGFAVVADEIRRLAEQSADAVGTINDMLSELTENVSETNNQSELAKGIVASQVKDVETTMKEYNAIVNNIQKINSEIKELYKVSEEVNDGCKQVGSIVGNLSAASQENAAMTQETASSVEVILQNMKVVKEASGKVEELSSVLVETVDEFKL